MRMNEITYICERCLNCCRWPGFVNVGPREIGELARFLKISEHDFIQQYTRLRPNRDGLALVDKPNGECVFLAGRDCAVQPAKPDQCRAFPNRWNFPGWREVCAATPVLSSADNE